MAIDLKGRNFLTMLDFSREEILAVLQTARELKERFKGARIVLSTHDLDLGTVVQGDVVEGVIKVENTGLRELE